MRDRSTTYSETQLGRQKNKEASIFRLLPDDIKLNEIRSTDGTQFPGRLSRLVRANNVIVYSFSDSVFRVTVSDGQSRYDRLNIPLRMDDNIEHIFIDQTGCHCLVGLQRGRHRCDI